MSFGKVSLQLRVKSRFETRCRSINSGEDIRLVNLSTIFFGFWITIGQAFLFPVYLNVKKAANNSYYHMINKDKSLNLMTLERTLRSTQV